MKNNSIKPLYVNINSIYFYKNTFFKTKKTSEKSVTVLQFNKCP